MAYLDDLLAHTMPAESRRSAAAGRHGHSGNSASGRRLGEHLAELLELSEADLNRVADHHGRTGLRFGDAAVAMGLATTHDVQEALGLQFSYPCARPGQPGKTPELVMLNDPFGTQAESVRTLRSQLGMRLANAADRRRVVAVISAGRNEGRTWCAANLALALAQLGGRTLLVDADLRGPRLHRLFGLAPGPGLCGLMGERAGAEAIVAAPGVPGLFVLQAGAMPPNPLELVERPAFGALLRRLGDSFNTVLVDTPAAAMGADASVVASRSDATLVVARRDATELQGLQALLAAFAGSTTVVAGVVLNQF